MLAQGRAEQTWGLQPVADLIQLKTAKYKGVEFLFEEASTTGGNRLIKFNYPGSDKQSIEVQGKAPRSFTLPVWIPHENYYQERDNLLRVLEDGEEGVLTHPTFGDIEKVINGVYTLTEVISELGRAKITIPFEVNDSPGIPQQSGNLASQVQEESSLLNTQLGADLSGGYEVSANATGNFTDALETVGGAVDSLNTAASVGDPLTEEAAQYQASINAVAGKIGNLVTSPADLAESVAGLFESLNNLYDSPTDALGSMRSLFNFGDSDPVIDETTTGRIERKRNRDLMRSNMRVQALSYAYLNAGLIEYSTTDALELVQSELEVQYLDARDNQLLSNESLEQLDVVRVQAQKTLDDARVTTSSIITIETDLKPLSVLVYQYYGNTDLVDVIADLNNIKQNAFVEGEIRILTA